MKKRLFTLALCLVMVVSLLAGCGGGDKAADQGQSGETATGSVYWLNFKPEADAALQEIANTYTAETGASAEVATAAPGTY